jgi:hypothetical protein
MFDLENSIADWRKQMLAAGIKTPVPLEELETHLREEIEQQIKAGTSPQQAFEKSVQEMGDAGELKGEFSKACDWHRYKLTQRTSARRSGRWSLLRWGIGGLVVNWILLRAEPLMFHQRESWAVYLPYYVACTTYIIGGLLVGLARWQTRWTFFWVSSLGLIGTMMANLICEFVFHENDWISIFLQRAHYPWRGFYLTWMVLIAMSLFAGLTNCREWVREWILQRKAVRG